MRNSAQSVPGRVLGIDYGSRRVGLALSDPLRIIAQGAGTLENDGTLVARVADLAGREGVTLIVVGMPYRSDGSRGTTGPEIDQFMEQLQRSTPVPVTTIDESFTSVGAKRVFMEGGMRRKQRAEKARVDEMAARLLLQEFLDGNPT